ncbi:hypothetical protein FSP39_015209 [Pinctada imbricata]|uniref:Endonuclease/exonuclease/phosphatase domain-containing protein n=1 Tax=Pinctada imbricata TaxID=66713 RepID=A0AA88Y3Z2_PINIB|nr:hypothetical protein FSP39_015209 [Pinctada imbricata]
MTTVKVREKVRSQSYRLRNTRYSIQEQYPKPISDRRKELQPIMHEARRRGDHVTLVKDKLYINGSLYSGAENDENDDDVIENDIQPSIIKLISWNINGGFLIKFSDTNFRNFILEHDLITLTECWLDNDFTIDIPDFTTFYFPRRKTRCIQGGGTIIIVRNIFAKFVSIVQNYADTIIWIKLDRALSCDDQDMYIACVYLPPSNSNYFKHYDVDLFFDIENQIQYYSSLGKIILTGDFNARTSNLPDYIESDQLHGGLTRFLSAVFDYCSDESLELRKTSDLNTNDYGYKLLSLCRSSGLRILNGRVGDSSEFTFAGGRGLSVIDYLILAPDAFRLISDFRIDDFNVYSDHAPLLISLICRSHQQNDHDHVNAGNFEKIRCLKWDADSANLADIVKVTSLSAIAGKIRICSVKKIHLSDNCPVKNKTKEKNML